MAKFGLIGFPIGSSQSPRLFAEAFPEHFRQGCTDPWTYELIETPDFEQAWRRFTEGGYKAVNVTSPFKEKAFRRVLEESPALVSEEVRRIAAVNILVNKEEGIAAFNSDYLAVKEIVSALGEVRDAAVIGLGGAGKAALAALKDSGIKTSAYHHTQIQEGIEADLVVYTLPCACAGCDKIKSTHLLESNYKNPCLTSHPGYISGMEWLRLQAGAGYPLFF